MTTKAAAKRLVKLFFDKLAKDFKGSKKNKEFLYFETAKDMATVYADDMLLTLKTHDVIGVGSGTFYWEQVKIEIKAL